MVRVKYFILPILILLNFNAVTGTFIFSSLCNILSFLGNLYNNEYSEANLPSQFPILKLVTPISVCNTFPTTCSKTRYRSINGSCNNLENPGWGTPSTTYGRVIASKYDDDTCCSVKSISGNELPNVRRTSLNIFQCYPPKKDAVEANLTLLGMQIGQILVHDICCHSDGKLTCDATNCTICSPIIIPNHDPIHKKGSCLDFPRTISSSDIGCAAANKPREQLTAVTTFIDCSLVYGSSDELSNQLRTFEKGCLKTTTQNSKEWPPQDPDVASACAGAKSSNETCFLGGDDRINQNLELCLIQVILVRYHNYIAKILAELNPTWNDEMIFQETRRIVIAVMQNIFYYEYFEILLGKENLLKHELIYETEDYVNDYDKTVNPAILNEHATAAFRYFHTLICGTLDLEDDCKRSCGNSTSKKQNTTLKSLLLSDNLFRPKNIIDYDEELVLGFTKQPSCRADRFFDNEITSNWLRFGKKHGSDLRAIDIQRGRDHGLASYTEARAACQLPVPKSFYDLCGIMYPDAINQLKCTYAHVNDIDLSVGSALELNVKGTLVGPLSLCLILQQLYRSRKGDRFFFENGSDTNIRFTLAQLNAIRKTFFASILCATMNIKCIQKNPFLQVSESNPRVSCDEINQLNLLYWKNETTCS